MISPSSKPPLTPKSSVFAIYLKIGLEAAKAEGETKAKANDILRILARQQGTVPESLVERIRVITNIEKLDQLFDLAFDCKSLDEFAKHLP